MRLLGARRRAWNRLYAGRRGYLQYAAAYPGTRSRLGPSGPAAARSVEGRWWHRLIDDRDLIGVKLLLLAAVVGVTVLLEQTV